MKNIIIYCSDPYAYSAEEYFNQEHSNLFYVEDLKKLIDESTIKYIEERMISSVNN
jgi:hypothetical protein